MAFTVSLANKCQLLFGGAVIVIVSAALVGPWMRLPQIVDESQMETSRQIAELWAVSPLIDPEIAQRFQPSATSPEQLAVKRNMDIHWWPLGEWQGREFGTGFLARAKERIDLTGKAVIEHARARWDGDTRLYLYARLVMGADEKPQGVVVVERRSPSVSGQLMLNRVFLVAGGIAAGALAMLVFYLITTRIILSPVRVLRETAERVGSGDLTIRSDLKTGDEFEQLAGTFNVMLTNLEQQQQQLRGINKSLDLRLNELAERNTALYEAARVKGEFLANVSHELRTPLNSIIGFAEVLQDLAAEEAAAVDPSQVSKRRRYLDNIVNAGRTLLVMINELLAMAKIEAGSIEVHVETVNVGELCEALISLIRPLSDRKGQRLTLQLPAQGVGWTHDATRADLPIIATDQQKLHQIIFNFLSNAVKFTPEGGEVTMRAERLVGTDGVGRVRISVLDTGPGIAPSQHAYIFEKFSQLDSSHTKKHQGTGLGLAIAKEFAELLQGEIQLVSEVNRGSMFSLILPLAIDEARTKEAKRRLVERAALARRPAPPRVTVGS